MGEASRWTAGLRSGRLWPVNARWRWARRGSGIAKVLTPENRETVLPRFFHRSKQQAKVVAAELAPIPDPPIRELVTSLSRAAVATCPNPLVLETSSQTVLPGEPTQSTCSVSEVLTPPAPLRDEIVPVTGDRNRLHLSVSRAFTEKLEAAKMALSHVMPGASMEQVFEAGLDLILARDAKKKALVAKPRPAKEPSLLRFDTRYIPAEIRREVGERDDGRCQHRLENEVYGRACMQRFRTRGRAPPGNRAPA
jgi:hypothetical protein